jgi:hypothetical protein
VEWECAGGFVGGRVQWKFDLSWAPGGEDFLPGGDFLLSPWWSPSSNEDLNFKNAMPTCTWRDLKKSYNSVLPPQLLESFGSIYGQFPQGWHCVFCGRLNEQILFRHRRCSCLQVSCLLFCPRIGKIITKVGQFSRSICFALG